MGLFSSKKKSYLVACADGFIKIGGLIYTLEFSNLEIEARNKYKEEYPENGKRLDDLLNDKGYKEKTMQIPNPVDLLSRPKPIDTVLVCKSTIEKLTGKSIDELRKESGTKFFEYTTVGGTANTRHISFAYYFE